MATFFNEFELQTLQNFTTTHLNNTNYQFNKNTTSPTEKYGYYLHKASNNSSKGINDLAKYYLEIDNFKRSYEIFKITFDRNDIYAYYYIGTFYMKGLKQDDEVILHCNTDRAFKYVKKAALRGLGAAQCRMGTFFEKGIGCVQNIFAAKDWYQKATEHNHPNDYAMCMLGEFYETGKGGLPIDYQKAYDCYLQAESYEYSWATYKIALMYKEGHFFEKDLYLAREKLEQARQQGSRMAKYEIGTWYEFGIDHNDYHIEIDIEQALKYYYECVEGVNLNEIYRMDEESNFACYRIAVIKENNGEDYINWYKRAAYFGNWDALEWCNENQVEQ